MTLVSYAEVLDTKTKETLESRFSAPVVQIYQGAEGFIGSTCKNGRLHVNEDILYLEMEDAGDANNRNIKNVILTDLYRITQPVIRYRLNDLIEIDEKPCGCGSCFKVIKQIHGRADDLFYLKSRNLKIGRNGETQTCILFPDYIRRSINQASDAVLEYQVIQHSIDSIEIRLKLKDMKDLSIIEKQILHNLEFWAVKIDGELGNVKFNTDKFEPNPQSKKMIRIERRY